MNSLMLHAFGEELEKIAVAFNSNFPTFSQLPMHPPSAQAAHSYTTQHLPPASELQLPPPTGPMPQRASAMAGQRAATMSRKLNTLNTKPVAQALHQPLATAQAGNKMMATFSKVVR